MFILILIRGSLLTISSNSWFSIWIGLEINLLSFIPLITRKKNLNYTESSLNYFLIQAFASSVILFSIRLKILICNYPSIIRLNFIINTLIITSLIIKLGIAPFHFWLPNVRENSSWNINYILLTWQKLAPFFILSYLIKPLKFILLTIIILTTFTGSIGGLNQTSLRKLIAFSSINQLGWMLIALIIRENILIYYLVLYFIIILSIIKLFNENEIYYINQINFLMLNSKTIKILLIIIIMSLGGLPPFLGFIGKWLVIQGIIKIDYSILTIFSVLIRLITLFYYLKVSITTFLININEINYRYTKTIIRKNIVILIITNLRSAIAFPIIMFILII